MLEEERVKLERQLDIVSAQTTLQGIFADTRAVIAGQGRSLRNLQNNVGVDGMYNGRPVTTTIVHYVAENPSDSGFAHYDRHNLRIEVTDKDTHNVLCDASISKGQNEDYWRATLERTQDGEPYSRRGGNPITAPYPASDLFEGTDQMKFWRERKAVPPNPLEHGMLPEIHSVAAMMKDLAAAATSTPTVLVGSSV